MRIVEANRPEAFIFENVRGLISPVNQKSFELIIHKFEKIGYRVYYKLLNSADFELPQNRERVFIIGIRKDLKEIYRNKKYRYITAKYCGKLQGFPALV